MDAAGNAVEDVAEQLLGQLGPAIDAAKALLGLDPPAGHPGVPTIGLADLMGDPLGAVGGYWRTLLSAHADAVPAVLEVVRDALADAAAAAAPIRGAGSAADPWRDPARRARSSWRRTRTATRSPSPLAAGTKVDTLGQRCTVIETRLAATLAEIDFAASRAQLLPSVAGRLVARERGVNPPRAALPARRRRAGRQRRPRRIRPVVGGDRGLSATSRRRPRDSSSAARSFRSRCRKSPPTAPSRFPAEGWDATPGAVGHISADLLPGFAGDWSICSAGAGSASASPRLRSPTSSPTRRGASPRGCRRS